MVRGVDLDWAHYRVPPEQVNSILAGLCNVMCVIAEEVGADDASPKVNGMNDRSVSEVVVCANFISRGPQMMWWAMDETLAELFAWHDTAADFEGNPRSTFFATIERMEYGWDEMLESIGLYGRRYMIAFNPGEMLWMMIVHARSSRRLRLVVYVCRD
jgi:hypothetical protein